MKETDHQVERPAVVAPHPGARWSQIFVANIDQLMELGKSFALSKICINSSESVFATKLAEKKRLNPNSLEDKGHSSHVTQKAGDSN